MRTRIRPPLETRLSNLIRERQGTVTPEWLARQGRCSVGRALSFLGERCVRVLDSETMEVVRWMVR